MTNTKRTPKKGRKGVKRPARSKAPAPRAHPLMVNAKEWDKPAVMDIICNAIASSSRAITSILAAGYQGHSLPDYSTVSRWLCDDEANNPLAAQYRRAKESQAEYMAEELAELHNKAWVPAFDKQGEVIRYPDGSIAMTVSKESAQIVRLESDNKKWLMGKLKPKRFGDKITNELTAADGLSTLLYNISKGNGSAFTPVMNDPDYQVPQ